MLLYKVCTSFRRFITLITTMIFRTVSMTAKDLLTSSLHISRSILYNSPKFFPPIFSKLPMFYAARVFHYTVYHKLKVTRPKEKLIAAQCLQLLTNDESEGNLTTIFSQIRNNEQYWVHPHNDLNCMTFHYGPAT